MKRFVLHWDQNLVPVDYGTITQRIIQMQLFEESYYRHSVVDKMIAEDELLITTLKRNLQWKYKYKVWGHTRELNSVGWFAAVCIKGQMPNQQQFEFVLKLIYVNVSENAAAADCYCHDENIQFEC